MKLKDVRIHDSIHTKMGGIRVSHPIVSKETIDEGTLDECAGLNASGDVVRGGSAETGFFERVETAIAQSLLSGELKGVFQNKTLNISDFPLTSDLDNQHDTVNTGLLPNGDMEGLTESQINKLVLSLNRIINKGWLQTSSYRAINLTSVMYSADVISVVASSLVFGNSAIVSGISYLITLDIANASYSFSTGSYN